MTYGPFNTAKEAENYAKSLGLTDYDIDWDADGYWVISGTGYGYGGGTGGITPEGMSQQYINIYGFDVGSAYLSWLYNCLKQLYLQEKQQDIDEYTYGDPDDPDSSAAQMGTDAETAINSGAFLTSAWQNLPNVLEFMSQYQEGSEFLGGLTGGGEGGAAFPEGTVEQIPGVLWYNEGTNTYYSANGYPIGEAEAQMLYNNYYGLGEETLTPEEMANLNLQNEYLQAQIDQIYNNMATSGQMSEYESAYLQYLYAQLEQNNALQQQQLQLEYNQYLAEVQANPADWIEKWAFENLPWGSEAPTMIGNYPVSYEPMTFGEFTGGGTTGGGVAGGGGVTGGGTTGGVTGGGGITGGTHTGVEPTPLGTVPWTDIYEHPAYSGLGTLPTGEGLTPQDISNIEILRAGAWHPVSKDILDPVTLWLVENYGEMDDDEIAWWLQQAMSVPGDIHGGITIPWDELEAKAFELFGGEISASEMREYARLLRDLHNFEQATTYQGAGVYPGLSPEEYSGYPWRMKLSQEQAKTEAQSMSLNEWLSLYKTDYETLANALARYYNISGITPPDELYLGDLLVGGKAQNIVNQYGNITGWNMPASIPAYETVAEENVATASPDFYWWASQYV